MAQRHPIAGLLGRVLLLLLSREYRLENVLRWFALLKLVLFFFLPFLLGFRLLLLHFKNAWEHALLVELAVELCG